MVVVVETIDLRGRVEGCGLNPMVKLLEALRDLKQGEAIEVIGEESVAPYSFLEDVARNLDAKITIREKKGELYKALIYKE